jgi:hypothetical protein
LILNSTAGEHVVTAGDAPGSPNVTGFTLGTVKYVWDQGATQVDGAPATTPAEASLKAGTSTTVTVTGL